MEPLHALVRQAGRLAQEKRRTLTVEVKGDRSLVTNVDRELEEWLRARLAELLPGSAVWGEEGGHTAPGPAGLWIVDPIDGTSNYAHGSPLWGVSVGFYDQGALLAGAVSLPDLDETYVAARGAGALRDGVSLPKVPPSDLRPHDLVSYSDSFLRAFPERSWVGKMRCSGSFVVDACFAATSRIKGIVGYGVMLYDAAATVVLARELGMEVLYLDGEAFSEASHLDGSRIFRPFVMMPRGALAALARR